MDACYLLLSPDFTSPSPLSVSHTDLLTQLESKIDAEKRDALGKIIGMLVSGEPCARMLMPGKGIEEHDLYG